MAFEDGPIGRLGRLNGGYAAVTNGALWSTAAVPYVRRKRVLEESASCREGQLTGSVANSRNRPILLKNSKSQRQQIFVQHESNRKIAPRSACGPLRGSTLRHQLFLVPPQLEASLAL